MKPLLPTLQAESWNPGGSEERGTDTKRTRPEIIHSSVTPTQHPLDADYQHTTICSTLQRVDVNMIPMTPTLCMICILCRRCCDRVCMTNIMIPGRLLQMSVRVVGTSVDALRMEFVRHIYSGGRVTSESPGCKAIVSREQWCGFPCADEKAQRLTLPGLNPEFRCSGSQWGCSDMRNPKNASVGSLRRPSNQGAPFSVPLGSVWPAGSFGFVTPLVVTPSPICFDSGWISAFQLSVSTLPDLVQSSTGTPYLN